MFILAFCSGGAQRRCEGKLLLQAGELGQAWKQGLDIFRKGLELAWSWDRPLSIVRQRIWRETDLEVIWQSDRLQLQVPALYPAHPAGTMWRVPESLCFDLG